MDTGRRHEVRLPGAVSLSLYLDRPCTSKRARLLIGTEAGWSAGRLVGAGRRNAERSCIRSSVASGGACSEGAHCTHVVASWLRRRLGFARMIRTGCTAVPPYGADACSLLFVLPCQWANRSTSKTLPSTYPAYPTAQYHCRLQGTLFRPVLCYPMSAPARAMDGQ